MFKVVKNTRRVRRSISPPVSRTSGTLDTTMTTFFNAESAASANTKPWLRLERGLRLQKFRAFAEEYPDISAEERELLYKALLKANDVKVLNTKQQIQYEEGKIVGIRGLKLIRTDTGSVFKIDTSRPTKRKIHKEGEEKSEEEVKE
jgi:hypothetical protein